MFKSRDRSWIKVQRIVTQERTVYTHQLFGKGYENVFENKLPINYRTFSTILILTLKFFGFQISPYT